MNRSRYFQFQKTVLAKILFVIIFPFSVQSADIVLNFCPITKIQASHEWSAGIQIQNNSGVVLDLLNNNFILNWPGLVSLQYPFSNVTHTGTNWSFTINLNWPGTMSVGATANLSVSGNNFSGALQFPTSGTYTQNGTTYSVEVKNCNQTQNYELYNSTYEFNRDCFLYSPAKFCLGQGATEIWYGEGVFDAMIPTNRPSWAIGVMVAHRLFTNLVGEDILSPNFWMATAMNESRMTCDPTIAPNLSGGHFPINGNANTGTGVYNPTNNCFQVLSIGYAQIANNQPDLFAQTNAYGTAQYANVVDNGNWETGALALAYYHYQDMRYWDQIYCFNVMKTWKDAADPYTVEKIFYHAYHDGPNAGIALLNDIKANYTAATAATNMNTVVTTGGTWSQVNAGGSSQKVGNFTYLLDGNNGTIYPCSKADYTTNYLGCYNDPIKWTDVVYYLDRIKILYPALQQGPVQAAIQAVFNSINGGATINFEDLGKVIDEIVIQMGGHDPSKYIATQFAASKTCTDNAMGVSLQTNDTICPGTAGELQVWLSGNKNFKFTLLYPNGSTQTFSNVDHSPFIVPINQPGPYEIIYFEDSSRVGDLNCLFSKLTVQSKNGNIVQWDKSTLTGNPPCTYGPLVIKNTGPDQVSVTYTYNGGFPQTVNIPAGTSLYTVSTNPAPGQYIITTMTPNKCGTPVNDTIRICSDCTKPRAVISGGASICAGDSVQLTVTVSGGIGPYNIKLSDGTNNWNVFNINGPVYTFYVAQTGTYMVDSVWNSNCDTLGSGLAVVNIQALPTLTVSGDTTICAGDTALLHLALTGHPPFALVISNGSLSVPLTTGSTTYSVALTTPGTYTLSLTDSTACVVTKNVTVLVAPDPTVDLGADIFLCYGESVALDAGSGFAVYAWSGTGTGSAQTSIADTSGTYFVQVTNAAGCSAGDSVQVDINPKINATFASDSISICPGDSIQLSVTPTGGAPAYTYTWGGLASGTATSFTAGANGWYTVTVSDAKVCFSTDSIYVKTSSTLSINLADKTICENDSALLDCGYNPGNYTIAWSGGQTTQAIYINTAGTYSVSVTNNGACSGADSMLLTVHPLPDLTGIADTTAVCSGTAAIINSNLGIGYSCNWNPGNVTTPNLTTSNAGTYTLTVTNTNTTCVNHTQVNVGLYPLPPLSLHQDLDTCTGITLTLQNYTNTSPGLIYNWTKSSTGTTSIGTSPTLQITTADMYQLEISDAHGCKNSDTVQVNFRLQPFIDLSGGADTLAICKGKTLALNAGNPGMTYAWSPGGQSTQSIVVSMNGLFSVVVSNGNCKDTDAVYIQTIVLPHNVLHDTLKAIRPFYCFDELGSGVVLSALAQDNTMYNYLWAPGGETTQAIVITTAGTYQLTLSIDGCTEEEEITIIDYCEPAIYVPNAFTPNNDNSNDTFGPKGIYVNDYHFMIFDRWGELVFETSDLTKGWNGSYKGNEVQEAVFVWKLDYSENLSNGKSRNQQKFGTVTLLR